MKVAIGSDHAGFPLKQEVLQALQATERIGMAMEVEDLGCYDTKSVDYPDQALAVAQGVASGQYDRGILICGTGIGMSITANKVPGIRAALCHDTFSARATREHNDSNVLCMGARVIGVGPAIDIVKIWLGTDFSHDPRHLRRIDKISQSEAPRC